MLQVFFSLRFCRWDCQGSGRTVKLTRTVSLPAAPQRVPFFAQKSLNSFLRPFLTRPESTNPNPAMKLRLPAVTHWRPAALTVTRRVPCCGKGISRNFSDRRLVRSDFQMSKTADVGVNGRRRYLPVAAYRFTRLFISAQTPSRLGSCPSLDVLSMPSWTYRVIWAACHWLLPNSAAIHRIIKERLLVFG